MGLIMIDVRGGTLDLEEPCRTCQGLPLQAPTNVCEACLGTGSVPTKEGILICELVEKYRSIKAYAEFRKQ